MKIRDPERSDHILETAADLFGEFGYNGVRMEDIATRAGVAKGTLYLYFKDKDDLFLALVLQRTNHLFEQLRDKASSATTPEDKLLIVVRESVEFFRSQPHIFAVIQRLDYTGSEAQTEALRANRDVFLAFTASIIAELKVNGHEIAIDPGIASRILCGMMRELLFLPPETTCDLPQQIVHLFLYGISAATCASKGR